MSDGSNELTVGRIVVLGGPPGAGKSTISRALLDEVERCVRVDGDDFLLGPWMIDVVDRIGAEAGAPVDYVILRAPSDRLVERVLARPPKFSDEAVIRKMVGEFAEVGDYERNVVSTEGLSVEETVAEVRRRTGI
jgi:gluconate kinase